MKNKLLVIIIIAIGCLQLNAAVRKPMFENFTNCACGPCWNVEPNINSFLGTYRDSVTVVRYHYDYPDPNDPFYVHDDYLARSGYYGVSGVPDCYMAGFVNIYPSSSGVLINAYNQAMAEPCYVELQLSARYNQATSSGTLHVTIIAEQEPGPGNYLLHHAVCSELVPYGQGYFSQFHQAMRDLFQYSGGWPVHFDSIFPDTVVVSTPFQLDTTWWHYDYDQLYFAVWLQSGVLPDKNIYQSVNYPISQVVGIEEQPYPEISSPLKFNTYPNPFIRQTDICFTLSSDQQLSILIYDLSGRVVRNFGEMFLSPGEHYINWEGEDDRGEQVGAGVYRISVNLSDQKYSQILVKLR